MRLARPIAVKLRNRVGDVGNAPVIEDVAIRWGQFGRSREILRGDERQRNGRATQEINNRVAAFRASPAPHCGRRTMAAEFNCVIVRQANRLGPEKCDVGERLAVRLLADGAMAEKAADRIAGDSEARSAAKTGAILVHHAFPTRAIMIATALSEAVSVSVSMRKLRMGPGSCARCDLDHSAR
jgi:hypothetical protein